MSEYFYHTYIQYGILVASYSTSQKIGSYPSLVIPNVIMLS